MASNDSRLLDPDSLFGPPTEEEDARVSDPTWWDAMQEVLPSIGSGVRLNVSSYAGLPGDIEDLTQAGKVLTSKWGGASPEELQRQREVNAQGKVFANTEDVNTTLATLATNAPAALTADSGLGAVEAAVAPVEPWHPKTKIGQGIETLTSMIGPGALTHIGRNIIAPLIGSEAGALVGAQMGPEEEQLLSAGGGLAAGPLDEGARQVATRRIRGGPVTPEQARRLQTLQDENIPLTGGQALDSPALRYAEVGPYANRPKSVADEQLRAFTNAALRRVDPNITIDIADDATMTALQDRLSADYDNLVSDNRGVIMDPGLQNDLLDIGTAHERLMGGPTNDSVRHYFDRIVDAARQNGGVIPPDIFQQINSELSAEIKRARGSPQLSPLVGALGEMRDSMYRTIERNGQPEIAARAQDLGRRYRNFKTIEKSLVGGSNETAYGFITPEKLGQAVRSRDDSASYTQGRGDFDELVKAAAGIKALPNSGSAGRILPTALGYGAATGIGAAGAQLLNGEVLRGLGTLAGTAASAALPFVPGAYLNARPVRTSIVRRAAGEHPGFFDPMQMPPIIGMSQKDLPEPVDTAPAGVAPDTLFAPPPAPDKQSLLENDYPVPVDLVDPADVLRRRGLRYG